MTSKVTRWIADLTASISDNLRKWLAYKLMGWAVRVHTSITVQMAMALARENVRQQMEMYGIDSFNPDYDADGNEVIRVTRREPTVH